MKRFLCFILAAGLMLAFMPSGYSYTEEVGLKMEQVWPAVQETFKSVGISKEDISKKTLRTKWIYDQVVRRGKYLKNFISQKYDRRYRLKVTLSENFYFTKIEIKGVYQERSLAVTPETPWRTVKPKRDDLEVERAYFFRILTQLEKMKKENRI